MGKNVLIAVTYEWKLAVAVGSPYMIRYSAELVHTRRHNSSDDSISTVASSAFPNGGSAELAEYHLSSVRTKINKEFKKHSIAIDLQ